MALATVALDDRYRLEKGRVYLNGTQALVRLLVAQKLRDQAAGLDTGGFVSGYRGSPLGGFDRELWSARTVLNGHGIHFWPGVNEDLAATAVWGTQQTGLTGDGARDGVFGMWYGKGAGLDRCGDVMRHAHGAGTAPRGGVLAVVGDDHAQKSSTHPYNAEPTFADLMMPVLAPADVGEVLGYGLLGWAMSRYSGCWVGLKTMAEMLDCSTSLDADLHALAIRQPEDFSLPDRAVHIRWPDPWPDQEARLVRYKLEAAMAFARANGIDRVVADSGNPRLGIVTTGKSYHDLRQALADLGIPPEEAGAAGLRIYKVGMPWPLEPQGLLRFAEGLDEILVVEEKRGVVESQLKELLYGRPGAPKVTGKRAEDGSWQFPWIGELSPDRIARVLAARMAPFHTGDAARRRLAVLDQQEKLLAKARPVVARPPYFCSGCPHNSSTKVPQGSRAIAGVGCHYMAVGMDRNTATFPQMGGEGVAWIGQAPFSRTSHTFVNLGEGTYFHSGSLAVRACVAAGVNITFKLLFNDAVAMTGGQPVDGTLTVPQLAAQLRAEGVGEIVVVSDEPEKYPVGAGFPRGVGIEHRDRLDEVQRRLRDRPGVTALIYDQTCAAEKRRRRKRGTMPDPAKRVFINDLVCEGCGDCSKTSNCLSVTPLETEFGRKRTIDQSGCNKDLSCVGGFCPSFVTVEGGTLKRPKRVDPGARPLPVPDLPPLDRPYNLFITGVGGTGVVTIGALLGMAAHLEGKACAILDQMGMAQKGGAVVTHVRIAADPAAIQAVRVPTAGADLLLGCDLVVALHDGTVAKMAPGRGHAILNTHETITGDFPRDPDAAIPTGAMVEALRDMLGRESVDAFDATALATRLMGDSIATNLFMLGYAYQKGRIPVSAEAILRAIELNGVAVKANLDTFTWGRRAALDRSGLEGMAPAADSPVPDSLRLSETLEEVIARRAGFLTDYQDAAYADRYRTFVQRVGQAEQARTPGRRELTDAVARNLFKLMAYKDEYEVARLYAETRFMEGVRERFDGRTRLRFHLAPPLLAARDPSTGHLRKTAYGPWLLTAFRLLARLRRLRGTPLDPFGRTAERRMERRMIELYRTTVADLLADLTDANHALAVSIARLPEGVRGFGHVKEANMAAVEARRAELLAAWRQPSSVGPVAHQAAE
ncbi:indolepyruvate ferredoxin oxidoreductase family protein [Azospirillum sp. RWY-5-1]|uniref:Indolepyruvate ferredoxin oxidoreductase family protein n=1 Tax=Azospirillum oleiclasticum TaxID=2735135 RepID=A0ABX2TG30_9PROT|nr:indolepyruvate ferredoxin oxidoreductase family protein [Azospirillum oleiclasticum]NYZ15828.1 indolepyruvate ferredoxin oxidoreductase family protein [Azospirillum oleiclasticum]NYZ22098.1 indolepyruvate ferredoxin oxidoreductase family protein [Azospirillum oleiclasticum]